MNSEAATSVQVLCKFYAPNSMMVSNNNPAIIRIEITYT
jgi:hypothetical protein